MNYELALKLKNAGFPQPHSKYPIHYLNPKIDEKYAVYVPILEELIEACGGKDIEIQININDTGISCARKWLHADEDGTPYSYDGSTPLEAVAHLYLKLHENKS